MERDNLRGTVLMVVSMALFAVEDVFLKLAAAQMPVGQVLMIFGAFGLLGFGLLVLGRGQRILDPAMLHPALLLRAIGEAVGRLGYTLAIALTPLASASAILQATPLVVVLGAALVFGERVGWRRILAILGGFAGVLIILRPGLDGFMPASLWAVLGMFGLALRDLATRAAPRALSHLQLGFWGFAVLLPTGGAMLAASGGAVTRAPGITGALALGAAIGVAAYYLVIAAMRTGEISAVTPFRYSRIIFAVVLGVAIFDEWPDGATLAGAAVVVGCGVYTVLRERRLARARR